MIPTELKFLGQTITVHVDNDLLTEREKQIGVDPDRMCCGIASESDLDIRLREGMDPTRERRVFIHEVLHHIDDGFGIGMDERQIHTLSTGLDLMIQGNPDLAGFLVQRRS